MKTTKQPKKTKAEQEADELDLARRMFAAGNPIFHPKQVVLVLTKRDTKPSLADLEQGLELLEHCYRYPNYRHQVTTAINEHWGAVDRKAAKAKAELERQATLVPMFELPPPIPKSERRRPGETWRG